ncbi:GATOR1 complex protein NPRL2 isoform X1 [Cylas formicarius]|uniref:GATOR1 complex protein NPRL2 isoform X1 n=1 Tax=Cylas formicarius TaxID=197179 RepID=UPI002958AEC5|nr:GATOR1 complex protein NPRL2 isoform X1 [Cylas formicarius]XP_060522938.1 GATOR1 complex protein NPRL2 isoform X1 [Cylas formicarius]XP_060522939.1 GATOR1 complex protein NPRL2 isoform X1 [Cylas formicarius]
MDLIRYITPRYEGKGKEGPIRAIFFCEFHHTMGPIISCQVPENFISKELFDSINVYIITKADLQRSTITVTLENYKILGFPVRIDNKKYARNAFLFNLCFVCDSDARTVQYETVVTKFSEYLLGMEMECCFLSSRNSSSNLMPVLQKVMNDLNNKGECALTEGPMATYLKVCQIRKDPQVVLEHQVPIFIKTLPEMHWDLTTQQVAPYIDGYNHVAKIACLADVDTNIVKACVQNLLYYDVVALIPVFMYGNVYCATSKLKFLAQDSELQFRCLHYVARSQRQLPILRDVFRMYASMSRGTKIKDLCLRFNFYNLRVNERKLVQFGILEGIIRRVHKFPVILCDQPELRECFSGLHTVDEICCAVGASAQQLDDQLDKDHNAIVLYK